MRTSVGQYTITIDTISIPLYISIFLSLSIYLSISPSLFFSILSINLLTCFPLLIARHAQTKDHFDHETAFYSYNYQFKTTFNSGIFEK